MWSSQKDLYIHKATHSSLHSSDYSDDSEIVFILLTIRELRRSCDAPYGFQIVRRINRLVKSRSHSVRSEVLKVLLALRIKDINLEKEKKDEIKQKKFMKHKQKLLTLSKKERKVYAFMMYVIKVSVFV